MARRPMIRVCLLLVSIGTVAIWHLSRKMQETHERLKFNQELLCVALAYHRYAEEGFGSPSGLADIEADRECFPQVYEMIRNGAFIIRWNAEFTGNGTENDKYVLGYAAEVPVQGGWVLLGGGGRRQMTADEFHAMPLIPTR